MIIETSYVQIVNRGEDDERRYRVHDEQINLEDTIFDPDSDTLYGDIFRDSQKEYGRCVSKVYVETSDKVKHIGWVFEKKLPYDGDADRYDHSYIQEVWVTLLDKDETIRTVEYHAIT